MSILTHTNLNYVRHDENNVEVSPQPAFRSESMDAIGWTNFEYRDYDGSFVRHLVDNSVGIISEFVKRDVDNNPIIQAQYIRHDENNNPMGSLLPIESEGIGNITFPNGPVVDRDVSGQVAGYKNGTEPITVEGQWQKQETPGGPWTGISPWVEVDTAIRTIEPGLEGASLRVATRIQDAVIAPAYITVHTDGSEEIQPKMTNGPKGTVTGVGAVGETLTKTESAVYGGIPPYEKYLEWRRRLTGSGDNFKKIERNGKPVTGFEYLVQPEDLGYDIQGTTRWKDSYGFVKVNTTSNFIAITA